jgi:chromosome segregation ATPase
VKSLLIRLLAAIGLVPARRCAALTRRANDLAQEARQWKKRCNRATLRVGELEAQVKRQHASLKEMRAGTERQTAELTTMQGQLEQTERALVRAREHLMAIEVKLDILEGAANVLDARTRTSPQRQADTTRAAV